MKAKLGIFLTVCLFLALGCSGLRKNAIKLSEQELKNAETTKTVAANYLKIWPIQSGFIRAALGENIQQLPTSAFQAMGDLDKLADKCNADECTDFELGQSLGFRVRILSDVVWKALETYAPDVIGFLTKMAL